MLLLSVRRTHTAFASAPALEPNAVTDLWPALFSGSVVRCPCVPLRWLLLIVLWAMPPGPTGGVLAAELSDLFGPSAKTEVIRGNGGFASVVTRSTPIASNVQVFPAEPGIRTAFYSAGCYYPPTATEPCKAVDGTYSFEPATPLQHGALSQDVIDAPIRGGECAGLVIHYMMASYTWTDGAPGGGSEPFTLHWTGPSGTGCPSYDTQHEALKVPPGKNLGKPDCDSPCEGNPIDAGTGNKFQEEADIVASDRTQLEFRRSYNSRGRTRGPLGALWYSTYHRGIFPPAQTGDPVRVTRADGRVLTFTAVANGTWKSEADVNLRLLPVMATPTQQTGWQVMDEDDTVERYGLDGRLMSITTRDGLVTTLSYDPASPWLLTQVQNSFGRTLTFTYNAYGLLETVVDPAGKPYTYGYEGYGKLVSVRYPGSPSVSRTYLYNETGYTASYQPYALTGIVDESGQRFASYRYNALGQAIDTEHAGGAGKVSLTYSADSTLVTVATDAGNASHTYRFATQLDAIKPTGVSGTPVTNLDAKDVAYDAQNNVKSRTDFNGNLRCYAYDLARNLRTARLEGLAPGSVCPADVASYTPAANTAQRKILTEWHANWRLPARVAEPKRLTTYVWGDTTAQCGAIGVLCKKIEQATIDATGAQGFNATPTGLARTWTFTYNSRGQVLSANGPRTDVNDIETFVYYADADPVVNNRLQLKSARNALGQVTTYADYDAYGTPHTVTDSNGVVRRFTFDDRHHLKSVAVAIPGIATPRTTTLDYYPTGLLWKVTTPDRGVITYTYDNAHRLIAITNGAGEKVAYTLDPLGNIKQEQTFAAGSLAASTTVNRKFDELGRLARVLNAANVDVQVLAYDLQSNLKTRTDKADANTAHDRVTAYTQYDALNRLIDLTDALSGHTRFAYDGQDRTVRIQDPSSHATDYTYNGLGDLQQEMSPDRGKTQNPAIDAAGNVRTTIDATGHALDYTYDVLNRATAVKFDTLPSIAYSYDVGVGAKGRISHVDDPTGSTDFTYNPEGRLIRQDQVIEGRHRVVSYAYEAASGRLARLTYPSGTAVTYAYDAAGRVKSLSVAVNGQPAATILDAVAYQPLGPVKSYRLPRVTGQPVIVWHYDADGRIDRYTLADATKVVTRNRLGDVVAVSDQGATPRPQNYGYDKLDRLGSFSAPVLNLSHTYRYDVNGNRTAKTVNTATSRYTTEPASNRLVQVGATAYTYDAAGRLKDNGAVQFDHDARGRLITATRAGVITRYGIDAFGRRVSKTSAALSTGGRIYSYDAAGHLIGEYDTNGARVAEHIYLSDVPVAVVAPAGGVFYVLTDHLATPRQIVDSQKRLRWRWDNADPFGTNVPNANPKALGAFAYNVRLPGQVYDAETGLHYNNARDYDPRIGRYIQPDPIGLQGGVNPYVYTGSNPLDRVDPDGRFWQAALGLGLFLWDTLSIEVDPNNPDALQSFDPLPGPGKLAAAVGGVCKVAKGASRAVDRPTGVPSDWLAKETKKGNGTQYVNPNNSHDRVRVMPGNPNSPNPAQQGPYVKRQIDGKFYDAQGRVVPGDSPEAHIPLDRFKF